MWRSGVRKICGDNVGNVREKCGRVGCVGWGSVGWKSRAKVKNIQYGHWRMNKNKTATFQFGSN